MKIIFFTFLLAISFQQALAKLETIAQSNSSDLKILNQVRNVFSAYSASSELDAKIVELLSSDGPNPVRMAVIFNSSEGISQIYLLDDYITGVTDIHFTNKDQLLVKYSQVEFDKDGLNIINESKQLVITVLRNRSGKISGKIQR